MDEKKSLLENFQKLHDRNFVVAHEFWLVLTLQKPDSKKFKDRLTDYTSAISAKMRTPWTQHVHPRLVEVIQGHMQGLPAPPTQEEKKHKKDKKDKEKKEKKEKDTKEKTDKK